MQPLYKFIIDRLLLRGGGTPAATTKGSSLRDVFGGIGGMGSRPFSTLGDQRQQMAAFVDWVYGAEQLIAEDVATIDFQVYVNRTSTKSRALVARSVLHPREFKALGKRRVEIRTKDFMGQAITEAAPAMQAARFLEAAVVAGLNIIVAGGTQAGKTTMLNCLAGAIPDRERVVTCKEVFELGKTSPVPTQKRWSKTVVGSPPPSCGSPPDLPRRARSARTGQSSGVPTPGGARRVPGV